MKIRYLITGLLVGLFAFASCAKPDELARTESDAANALVVNGLLLENNITYSSVVDLNAGTATVQVPWFISDTEEIVPDMTKMKVTASLPVGAKFNPVLSGVRNLAEGFSSNLVYEDGTVKVIAFKAVRVKSAQATLLSVTLPEAPAAQIAIREPETADGAGSIIIQKTAAIAEAMGSATMTISPWATFDSDAKNPDGTVDVSVEGTEITVTSQDGLVNKKYRVVLNVPAMVPAGEIGYRSLLFGFQTTQAAPHGFVGGGRHRTLAVVGNHLIVSDSGAADVRFPVFDRFTGELLSDVTVDLTGLVGTIHAITNDDAGHMVAISFAGTTQPNKMFEVYVWKNGITSAPTKAFSGDIMGDSFATWRTGNNAMGTDKTWDIGRHVAVKGNMVSGKAMLMSLANGGGSALILRMPFVDGVCAAIPKGSIKGIAAWGNKSKLIPLATEGEECPYIMNANNNSRNTIYYPGDGGATTIIGPGGQPSTTWTGGNTSMAYTEFNGMKIVAVANYGGASPSYNFNVSVADITSMPASFDGYKILNSRMDNYDPMKRNASGVPTPSPIGPGLGNSTQTGMSSGYAFPGETGPVLGSNGNATADVCFAKALNDEDAVQVYLLATDNAIIAYQITRYDM